jgi:hypothetical protein
MNTDSKYLFRLWRHVPLCELSAHLLLIAFATYMSSAHHHHIPYMARPWYI